MDYVQEHVGAKVHIIVSITILGSGECEHA